MRPITFPKTADGEWTNRETGVSVARRYPNGLAKYEVRLPDRVGCSPVAYRSSLARARAIAEVYVRIARVHANVAYVEACREDAERMAESQDDDLIHLWDGTRAPAACGVAVWSTPYTFGSPDMAEATCKACLPAAAGA
jgi:hypothetical protein